MLSLAQSDSIVSGDSALLVSISDTLRTDTLNGGTDSTETLNTTILAKETRISQADSLLQTFPEIQKRKKEQKTWVFLLFVMVLIIIGFTRSINIKKHLNLLSEVIKLRSSSIGFDNHIGEITLQNILYLFLQSTVLAYIFYTLFDYSGIIAFHSGFQAFLFTLIMFIGIYVIKFFIYRIITTILDLRDFMPVMFSLQTVIGYVFTVSALPLVVLAYYVKSAEFGVMIFNLLGIVGIVYVIYRFIKVFLLLALSTRLPRIYLFLYLCTLEIIPLLVMINWLGLGWI